MSFAVKELIKEEEKHVATDRIVIGVLKLYIYNQNEKVYVMCYFS